MKSYGVLVKKSDEEKAKNIYKGDDLHVVDEKDYENFLHKIPAYLRWCQNDLHSNGVENLLLLGDKGGWVIHTTDKEKAQQCDSSNIQ